MDYSGKRTGRAREGRLLPVPSRQPLPLRSEIRRWPGYVVCPREVRLPVDLGKTSVVAREASILLRITDSAGFGFSFSPGRRDAIDDAGAVVGDEQRAVRSDGDAHGPTQNILLRRVRHKPR